MKLPVIGFGDPNQPLTAPAPDMTSADGEGGPRRSVVQVWFPDCGRTLAYYNDQFDLHRGDIVYVDGKLAGEQGRVLGVQYAFRIKLADYKRVIGMAQTRVQGTLYAAGSHFVTFDAHTMPYAQIRTWFRPPEDEEEFVSGQDEATFRLEDFSGIDVKPEVLQRGNAYYGQNKVVYLCVAGSAGRAIVTGTRPYELTFDLRAGEISNLTCDCFCTGVCKHGVAALLQLKDMLHWVEENHAAAYEASGYMAAVSMTTLFETALEGRENGTLTLA